MQRILLAAALAIAIAGSSLAVADSRRDAISHLGYDPQADPFEQYQAAIAAAKAADKLVLVIAGGDWCRWCHVLNRFVSRNPDVQRSLDDTFVVMKVYVGDENYNQDFFSQLPEARGAPHFWIVSPDRNVLGSQSTGALERGGNGYDKAGFLEFIERWKRTRLAARD